MLEYKQPVWRQKGSSPTTRLTCRETSNLSLGNYEYLLVSNKTVGKIYVIHFGEELYLINVKYGFHYISL